MNFIKKKIKHALSLYIPFKSFIYARQKEFWSPIFKTMVRSLARRSVTIPVIQLDNDTDRNSLLHRLTSTFTKWPTNDVNRCSVTFHILSNIFNSLFQITGDYVERSIKNARLPSWSILGFQANVMVSNP